MAVTTSGKDKLLRYARFYIGGYDLSGDTRAIGDIANNYEGADLLGVTETTHNFLAGGSLNTGITGLQTLMNDTSSSGAHELLKDAPNQTQLSICFGGAGAPAAGDPAYTLPSIQFGDVVSIDGSSGVMSANFGFDTQQYTANYTTGWGAVLRGPTSITATVTAGSAISFDGGAQTTAGWSAHLHVLATSSGDYAITIEDSADDSAYGTLGTFSADGSAVLSELLTGAGTVERYVSFQAVRTGGTMTAIVTFVRN